MKNSKKQTKALTKALQQRGLAQSYESYGKEVRHSGWAEEDALTTYERIYRDYEAVCRKTPKENRRS